MIRFGALSVDTALFEKKKIKGALVKTSTNVINTRIKSNYSYIKDVRYCFLFREVSVSFHFFFVKRTSTLSFLQIAQRMDCQNRSKSTREERKNTREEGLSFFLPFTIV